MNKIIEKYRKEAYDSYVGNIERIVPWRQAILEAIFKPKVKVPGGKDCMTHLHPNTKNLHFPPGCYIADWRKYKVEDHPALINFQKRCHAAGLHDPFLRNRAWAYYPSTYHFRSRFAIITQQCLWGFAAALVFYLGEKAYDNYKPYKYEHTPEYREKYGDAELDHVDF